jgi:hypothetical protein
MRFVLLALVLATLAPCFGSAHAQERMSSRDIVVAYNTGLRISIAPGVFLPSDGGRVGFSIGGDVRYGFEIGPTILAPGARVAAFFPSGFFALSALATGRITIPVGPLGPYLLGGVGPGYVSKPSQAGLSYLGGGGLMIHIGESFGIGAEAVYFGITGTDFRALFVGPSLLLNF